VLRGSINTFDLPRSAVHGNASSLPLTAPVNPTPTGELMKLKTLSVLSSSSALTCLLLLTACGGGGGGGGAGGMYGSLQDLSVIDADAADLDKESTETNLKSPPSAQACVVELYGDSIMAGNGSPETPAMTLHRVRPGLEVVDKAVAGRALMMLASTFNNDPRSASHVVIENGVIDSWRGVHPQQFAVTLRSMIDFVRAEGRTPVLTGFSRQVFTPNMSVDGEALLRRDLYDQWVGQIAEETKVPFADWGSVPFGGASDLLDGVHPGKAYSDRLVQKLAETLDGVALECTPPESGEASASA
jgi:GDSL-like Lipase/Acylhydrolase family